MAFKDASRERKSRNERHFAAAWYGKTSGFEVVHGLLDRVMAMLKSAYITGEAGMEGEDKAKAAYWITEVDGEFPFHVVADLLISGESWTEEVWSSVCRLAIQGAYKWWRMQ